MNIDVIIDKVIAGVNEDWPVLYKIRYVYVTLGKYLSKNTDFFFSIDNKLGQNNLSFNEIKDAYDNETDLNTSVICKSSSLILKMIYDKLGIKSRLVKSLNNIIEYDDGYDRLDINHWFLVVNDGENDYFCTLSSDLPYIQMGMETKHFGVNIAYKKVVGREEQQVYEGDEIKNSVINREDLREMDIAIGYIKNQYHYNSNYMASKEWEYNYDDASLVMLSEAMNSNKMYNDLEVESTYFYRDLMNFKGADGRSIDLLSTKISDINVEDWELWKRILCRHVLERINDISYYKINLLTSFDDKNWNYDKWLNNVCVQLQRYFFQYIDRPDESLYIGNKFNYSAWSRLMKKNLNDIYFEEKFDDILELLDKMNVLVGFINKGKFNANFVHVLNSLAYHFVHRENLFEESLDNGKISSKYIAHKFKKLFPVIFDCGTIGTFNNMNYSEQIVIIKTVLEKMFKELNKNNSSLEEYDDNYSAVFNRIQIYSIKNKKSGDYAVVFHIVDDGTYVDTYYFYDPKCNEFKLADIFDIYSNYIIVSNRFKSKIEEMENIEDLPMKKA